jgi:hypothetical protein
MAAAKGGTAGGLPGLTGGLAGLPSLPSPSIGDQSSSPDMLTGLIQNAALGIQTYQQMQEEQRKRKEQAMKDLQVYAPFAVANPTDPAAIKQIQKIAKQLGVDPKSLLTPEGGLNTAALAPYTPTYQAYVSSLSNPNATQETVSALGKLAGVPPNQIPQIGNMSTNQATAMMKQYEQSIEALKKGGPISDAQRVQLQQQFAPLVDYWSTRNPMISQSITNAIDTVQPTATSVAQAGATQALAAQRAQATVLEKARTKNVDANTIVEMHKVGLIDAQTAHQWASINTEATNAAANMMKAKAAMSQAGTASAKEGLEAINDANNSLDKAQSQINALQSQLTSMHNNNTDVETDPTTNKTGPSAQALAIKSEIELLQKSITDPKTGKVYQHIDTTTYAARGIQASAPSTTEVIPHNPAKPGTPPAGKSPTAAQPLKGKTFTTADVRYTASLHHLTYEQALKQVRDQGGIVKP